MYIYHNKRVFVTESHLFMFSRFLKQAGVEQESEAKERLYRNQILSDNLKGEMLLFQQKEDNAPDSECGYVMREQPCVSVIDLTKMVLEMLDKYDRYVCK